MRPHRGLSGTPRKGRTSSGTAPITATPWFPILLGTLLRLVQIWMPIVGIHSWRQADTAAMARHFHASATPIWLPQVDWGGATSGFVESEFAYPFLVSRVYGFSVFTNGWGGSPVVARPDHLAGDPWATLVQPKRRLVGWDGVRGRALGVYFGRTFQAEALLLFCAAAALDACRGASTAPEPRWF